MDGYLPELGNVEVSCISEVIHQSMNFNSGEAECCFRVNFPPPIYTSSLYPKPDIASGHIESMSVDQRRSSLRVDLHPLYICHHYLSICVIRLHSITSSIEFQSFSKPTRQPLHWLLISR